jgi:hypothetical protein
MGRQLPPLTSRCWVAISSKSPGDGNLQPEPGSWQNVSAQGFVVNYPRNQNVTAGTRGGWSQSCSC